MLASKLRFLVLNYFFKGGEKKIQMFGHNSDCFCVVCIYVPQRGVGVSSSSCSLSLL